MTVLELTQKLLRLQSDIQTAMSKSEKLWLMREIASTEERLKWMDTSKI
jgi:hypothetical protein